MGGYYEERTRKNGVLKKLEYFWAENISTRIRVDKNMGSYYTEISQSMAHLSKQIGRTLSVMIMRGDKNG